MKWIQYMLRGYHIWVPRTKDNKEKPQPGNNTLQTIMGIKHHIAVGGQAIQTPISHSMDPQHRLISIKLNFKNSDPLHITSSYLPAGDSPEELQIRDLAYKWIEDFSKPGKHIWTGDMNATLLDKDRTSDTKTLRDTAHQSFTSKTNHNPLDPPNLPRPHTWHHPSSDHSNDQQVRVEMQRTPNTMLSQQSQMCHSRLHK